MTRKATPADIVARLTDSLYTMTAETALAWGMGAVEDIESALNEAIEQGLVTVVETTDTTYGRNIRFVALAPEPEPVVAPESGYAIVITYRGGVTEERTFGNTLTSRSAALRALADARGNHMVRDAVVLSPSRTIVRTFAR